MLPGNVPICANKTGSLIVYPKFAYNLDWHEGFRPKRRYIYEAGGGIALICSTSHHGSSRWLFYKAFLKSLFLALGKSGTPKRHPCSKYDLQVLILMRVRMIYAQARIRIRLSLWETLIWPFNIPLVIFYNHGY